MAADLRGSAVAQVRFVLRRCSCVPHLAELGRPMRLRAGLGPNGSQGVPAEGLRFLGRSQRIIRSRPLAVAGSALARLGLIDAIATWPSASHPTVAINLRDTTSKAWMQPLLPSRARAMRLDPRTWQTARARALVVPRGRSIPVAAAEHALGRALVDPHVSLYSSSGCVAKLTCFIGEASRGAPTVVVKAMGRRSDGWWLRGEVDNLRAVRSRLSGDTRDALLQPPLFAGELDNEYLVVEAYGGFDGWSDRSPRASARAHAWLRDFHRSTTATRAAWAEADTDGAVATVLSAWSLLRPGTTAAVAASTSQALHQLLGVPLPRCAVHGDFSPGNLAEADGRLRVLDWEWSGLDGSPCFDLWTYQLTELQSAMAEGRVGNLDRRIDDALRFVEAELELADVDRRFALAMLPTTLSELVFRFRRTLGRIGVWELTSGDLMASVERLLSRHDYVLSENCAILGALGAPGS